MRQVYLQRVLIPTSNLAGKLKTLILHQLGTMELLQPILYTVCTNLIFQARLLSTLSSVYVFRHSFHPIASNELLILVKTKARSCVRVKQHAVLCKHSSVHVCVRVMQRLARATGE